MSTTVTIPQGTDSGSVVIGSPDTGSSQYTENGTPLSESYIVDGKSSRIAQLMLRSSMQHGERMPERAQTVANEQIVVTKTKKGRGKKNVVVPVPKYVAPLPKVDAVETVVVKSEPAIKAVSMEKQSLEHVVSFKNEFGQISLKVYDIIRSGDGNSLLVVMPADSSNGFTPTAGNIYSIGWGTSYDKKLNEWQAFFPGFIYEWPSNGNKLMILCKVIDTE